MLSSKNITLKKMTGKEAGHLIGIEACIGACENCECSVLNVFSGSNLVGWVHLKISTHRFARNLTYNYKFIDFSVGDSVLSIGMQKAIAEKLAGFLSLDIKSAIKNISARALSLESMTIPHTKGLDWLLNRVDRLVLAEIRSVYTGRIVIDFKRDEIMRPHFHIEEVN